jgi:hypothetical protein
MTIRTNPPGAMVYIDDNPIGLTPISTNHVYYGTRRIRLVKDGYQTETIYQPVSPPWYEIPPLDFFAENFVPGEIRDHHVFDYQLTPQMLVPTDQVLDRAEQLRRQTHAAAGVQPGAMAGPGGGLLPGGPGPGGFPAAPSGPLASPATGGPAILPGPETYGVPGTPAPAVAPGPSPSDSSPYPLVPPEGWRPRE